MPRLGLRHPRWTTPSWAALRDPRRWLDHRLWLLVAVTLLGVWNAARAPTFASFAAGWLLSCVGLAVLYWSVVIWSALFRRDHGGPP